jgi:hypothetical protein
MEVRLIEMVGEMSKNMEGERSECKRKKEKIAQRAQTMCQLVG